MAKLRARRGALKTRKRVATRKVAAGAHRAVGRVKPGAAVSSECMKVAGCQCVECADLGAAISNPSILQKDLSKGLRGRARGKKIVKR